MVPGISLNHVGGASHGVSFEEKGDEHGDRCDRYSFDRSFVARQWQIVGSSFEPRLRVAAGAFPYVRIKGARYEL